jgi:hypothetical protein
MAAPDGACHTSSDNDTSRLWAHVKKMRTLRAVIRRFLKKTYRFDENGEETAKKQLQKYGGT